MDPGVRANNTNALAKSILVRTVVSLMLEGKYSLCLVIDCLCAALESEALAFIACTITILSTHTYCKPDCFTDVQKSQVLGRVLNE